MSFPFTINELIKTYTPTEVATYLEDLMEANDVPAKSWKKGSVARTMLGVVAQVGSQASVVVSGAVAGMFLLLGKGNFVIAKAKDDYDVDRIAATAATGFVTLTNTGGQVYTVGANECLVRSSVTKKVFRITQGFTLGAYATSAPLPVLAVEVGAASTVSAGEITEFETPLARVEVTNEAAIVGRDAETEAELVARCLAKRGTWSPNGPRDAYEYAALSATLVDGTPTNITRVRVSPSSSTGEVYVVCATPSGAPTSDELDAVKANCLRYAKTDTDKLFVLAAAQVATSHAVTIWARGGDAATILARAQAAVATLISTYPIGGIAKVEGEQGYLYLDAIAAEVIRSSIDESTGKSYGYTIFDVDFAAGNADTALEVDEVATNTITFDVRIVR